MNWIEITVIATALIAAACLQASIGFGIGMLAAPVIAIIDPTLLPATVIMLAIIVTLIGTVRERQHLDVRGAGWALVGRIPGSALGAWLVVALPAAGLAWFVAVSVLAGVVMAFMGWAPQPHRRNLMTAGAASGIMGTATSIGGAPMAFIWQRSEGAQLRGTMSAFFLVGSTVSLAALGLAGAITAEILQFALWMIPAVLAGYVLSRYVNRFLDGGRLRIAALAVSGLGAAMLISQLIF